MLGRSPWVSFSASFPTQCETPFQDDLHRLVFADGLDGVLFGADGSLLRFRSKARSRFRSRGPERLPRIAKGAYPE
jgi:hypothetical protein